MLQYDDVMNRQREIIYGQRDKVLDGEDIREQIIEHDPGRRSERTVKTVYLPAGMIHEDWNLDGLRDYYCGWLTADRRSPVTTRSEMEDLEPGLVIEQLHQEGHEASTRSGRRCSAPS